MANQIIVALFLLLTSFLLPYNLSAESEESTDSIYDENLELLYLVQAKDSVRSGNPLLALRQLSYVSNNPQIRSQVLIVAANAFDDLDKSFSGELEGPKDIHFLLSTSMQELIARVLRDDESRKVIATKIYTWLLFHLLNTNDSRTAEEMFHNIVMLSNDEYKLNKLRYNVIRLANTPEEYAFARKLIADIKKTRSLTLKEQLGLFASGYYSKVPFIIILVALLTIIMLWALSRIVSSNLKLRGISKLISSKKKLPGYQQVLEEDEFSRMLQAFGLTEEATDEQIKARYRELVKSYHPDALGSASEEQISNFRDLKKAYERILEMKKHRFGG